MASTTYKVEIDLSTKGSLGVDKLAPGAKGATAALSKLSSGYDKLSSGVGKLWGMFDGVVSKAAEVTGEFSKWGALGAAGAITYGVVHLNNELEQTKIALGSIFQANGVAADLPTGMKLAQDTIAKMRVDAQKLPGEFEDLRNIFTTTAIPGFQAGATVDQLRDMSGKLMAFAKVAQIPMEQAAREAAMLLEGRAGAHNVLGMKLAGLAGDQAKAFNQENAAKRFQDVGKYLDKYKDSIDEFGKSWEGISSTTIDLGKQWLTLASAPVFDKAKGALSKINDWFNENRDLANSWAQYIGDKLGDGFDYAVVKIKEWGPAFMDFGKNAFAELKRIWDDIGPSVKSFAASVQEALHDPGTIDKLIRLAELWGAGKIAAAGLGAAGGVIQAGAGAVTLGKAFGLFGGAAAGASAAAIPAAAIGGSAYGGGLATAAFGAVAAAALPLTIALTGLGIAAYAATTIYDELTTFWKQDELAQKDAADKLVNAQIAMGSKFAETNEALAGYAAANNEAMLAALDFAAATSAAGASLSTFAYRDNKEIASNALDSVTLGVMQSVRDVLNPRTTRQAARTPQHPGGGGGTTNYITMTVSGNDEPNRVAALVVDKLNKQSRHRRTSPDVPNYAIAGI